MQFKLLLILYQMKTQATLLSSRNEHRQEKHMMTTWWRLTPRCSASWGKQKAHVACNFNCYWDWRTFEGHSQSCTL